MLTVSPRRSVALFAIAALLTTAVALIAASRAEATYLVPNFSAGVSTAQAGAHPKVTISIDPDAAKADGSNGDDLRNLTIDAPVGMLLNQASATTKCTDAQLTAASCPTASLVGTGSIKWRRALGFTTTTSGNAYVMTTPAAPNAAALGFVLKATGYKNVIVRAAVTNALPIAQPTRVSVTDLTRNLQSSLGQNVSATADQIDVVLNAKANSTQSGPYFVTNPTACSVVSTQATLLSYAGVSVAKSSSFTPTGCGSVPFAPTASVSPTVPNYQSPTGVNAAFTVPAAGATIQNALVTGATIALPTGTRLNQPTLAGIGAMCSDSALAADTCPSPSKIGTSSFTFVGASAAWPGDLYLTARGASGFGFAGIARGPNGATATLRGTGSEVDTNGDGAADLVRLTLDQLPGAPWSAAAVNVTSTLLMNACPVGGTTTTLQGANAAAVVRTGSWLIGACPNPPETTLTNVPPNPTASPTPTFAFIADQTGATFECQIDGGGYAACASPFTTPALTDGAHQVCVRAVAGGVADPTPACQSFVVDTTPPDIGYLDLSQTTQPGPATLTYLAYDAVGPVSCNPPSGTVVNLVSGANSITVVCIDEAGNAATATRNVMVTLPPLSVTITSGPSGTVTDPNVAFSYQVSEPVYLPNPCYPANTICIQVIVDKVTLRCQMDGGAPTTCPLSSMYGGTFSTSVSPGQHTFCVTGTRIADGAVAADCRSFEYVLGAPPTVLITAPAGGSITQAATVPVSYTVTTWNGVPAQCDHANPFDATLAEGQNSISVTCTDSTGQSSTASVQVTRDSTPPDVVVQPPPNPASTSVTIGFSATDASTIAGYECALDGSAYAACTSPLSLSGLSTGTHTVSVCATDVAGNRGCSSVSWTPPEPFSISIASGPPPLTTSTSATFTFTATTTPVSFSCSLDGGPFAACASPVTYSGISDGHHVFCVRGTDQYGIANANGTVCWGWDASIEPPPPPQLIRTSPASSPSNQTTATFQVTNVPSGSILEGSLDGAPYSSFTSPKTFTGLADGTHVFSARLVDAAGSSSSVSNVWVVDTIAPPALTVTRTSPTESPTIYTTQTIAYSGLEAGATPKVSLDGSAFATAGSSPITYTGLAQGTHTVTMRQVDAAGNTGPSTSVTWTVGGPPPIPSFTSTPTNPSGSHTATFAFTITEPGWTFQCQLDFGAWFACTSPTTLASLPDGQHTFCIRGVDQYGNTSSSSCFVWTVDSIPPVAPSVTRVSPTADPASSTSQTIAFSAAEAGGVFQGSLDGAAYAPVTSPVTLTGLSQGTHTYSVRQVDSVGNIGTPGSTTWTVDTIPPPAPVVVRTSPTASPTTSTSQTISFTTPEPALTCQGSRDGGSYATTTSPVTLTGLFDGVHTYSVRCIDAAGNVGAAATVVWTVSTEPPPPPTITSGPSGVVASTSATFAFTGSGAGTTLQCQLDGGPWTSCTSPRSFTGLTQGSHTFCIRAVDAAGNVGPPVCRTWTVDTTPPTISNISPADNSVVETSSVTLTYTATDGSGTPSCSPASGSDVPLSVGANTITITCSDAAGNQSTATTHVTRSDAAGQPVVTISSPAGGTVTGQSSIVVTYSVDQAGTTCSFPSGSSRPLTVGANTITVTCTNSAGVAGSASVTVTRAPVLSAGATCFVYGNSIICRGTPSGGVPPYTLTCQVDSSPVTCSTQVTVEAGLHSGTVCVTDSIGTSSCVIFDFMQSPNAGPLSITSGPSGAVNSSTATFAFSGALSGEYYECQIDGSSWSPCSSPRTYAGLNPGAHTFCLRLIDTQQKVGGLICRTWTVDATPPSISNISPADNSVVETSSVTLTYTATDASGTPSCSPASGSDVPLSVGANTITITCTDAAGNQSTATTHVTRSDPGSPPVVTISSPQSNFKTQGSSVVVTYSVSPSGSSCDIASGSSQPLVVGSNTITVTCTYGGLSGSASVTGQRATPLTLNPGCSLGGTTYTQLTCFPQASGGFPPYTYTCRVDGGAYVSCSVLQYYTLAIGSHTITICVTDSIGTTVCQVVTLTAGSGGGGGGGSTCPPGYVCLPSDPNAPQ